MERSTPGFYGPMPVARHIKRLIVKSQGFVIVEDYSDGDWAEELERSGLFPFGPFQLAIDPKLDPPDRKQIELGFGLARDDLVADAELPFPNARSDRRHGEFNTLVGHTKIPPRPKPL